MSVISVFLVLSFYGDAPSAKTPALQYLRPSGEKFVLESEIHEKKLKEGSTYQSVTHRSSGTMDLRITYADDQRILSAQTIYKTKAGTASARAVVDEKQVRILRGEKEVQSLKLEKPIVLVTTAPDWSDIILLLRRYDQKRGGKQTFPGLWFHPRNPAHLRKFEVEKVGSRVLTVQEKQIPLSELRVTLRSGAYVVWADAKGVVYLIRKPKQTKGAIVLSGYQKLMQGW